MIANDTNGINVTFFNANQNIPRILLTTALPIKKFYEKIGLSLNGFMFYSAVMQKHMENFFLALAVDDIHLKSIPGQTFKVALAHLTITSKIKCKI